MSKTKIIAVFMTATLLLSGCGSTKNTSKVLLYKTDKDTKEQVSYKTTEVKMDSYKEVLNLNGKIKYTNDHSIAIPDDGADLDKVCVKAGQRVSKGTVLAQYHVTVPKTTIEKRKLELDQARAGYQSQLNSKRNEIIEKKKSIKSISKKADKKIAQIELKRLQNEYSQIYNSGENVRKLEKDYRKLVSKKSKINLVSKYSGIVVKPIKPSEFSSSENNTAHYTGSAGVQVMIIRDPSSFVITAEKSEGKLRYNMTVDIGIGKKRKDIKYHIKGKVDSSNNLTEGDMEFDEGFSDGEEAGGEDQTIRISKADAKKYPIKTNNLFITATLLQIDDALLVDSDAVYEETENEKVKRYVWLVENGKLHKRYIVSSYQQDKYVLVDQGVEQGQTLAILKQ